MPLITTTEAAALLGVRESTLGSWQQRYGFPSDRSVGGEPRFDKDEIAALGQALSESASVAWAIEDARRRTGEHP